LKPWELVAVEEYEDRKAAARREAFLKGRGGIAARRELFSRSARLSEPM
jgi:predicted GIY-YIG superfamily endonuclease